MRITALTTAVAATVCLSHAADADDEAPSIESTQRPHVLTIGYMDASDGPHERAGFALELSARRPDSAVHIHALVAAGAMRSHEIGEGSFTQARIGVEMRGQGESIRLLGGVDIGFVRDQADHVDLGFYEQQMDSAVLFMFVPRFGVEVGQHLRMRATLDAPMTVGDAVAEVGLGVSLAAGVGF